MRTHQHILASLSLLAVSGGGAGAAHAVGTRASTSLAFTAPLLRTVDVVDATHGWVARDTILTTTDSGVTWRQQYPSAAPALTIRPTVPRAPTAPVGPMHSLDMVSSDTGWLVTTHHVYVTHDGGTVWTPVLSVRGRAIAATAFLTASTGWIATGTLTAPVAHILHTTDAGATWTTAPATLPPIVFLSFPDPRDGWALASPQGLSGPQQAVDLFRSTDGGYTWTRVSARGLPLGGIKTGFIFQSARRGYLAVMSYAQRPIVLWRTGDGGETWSAASFPPYTWRQPAIASAQAPFLFPSGVVVPVTQRSALAPRAVEATETWRVALRPTTSSTWRLGQAVTFRTSAAADLAIPTSFISLEDGWAATPRGLLCTTDGGRQWRSISATPLVTQARQLEFVTSSIGWAVLHNGRVTKTTDGGRTWREQTSPPISRLWSRLALKVGAVTR